MARVGKDTSQHKNFKISVSYLSLPLFGLCYCLVPSSRNTAIKNKKPRNVFLNYVVTYTTMVLIPLVGVRFRRIVVFTMGGNITAKNLMLLAIQIWATRKH